MRLLLNIIELKNEFQNIAEEKRKNKKTRTFFGSSRNAACSQKLNTTKFPAARELFNGRFN